MIVAAFPLIGQTSEEEGFCGETTNLAYRHLSVFFERGSGSIELRRRRFKSGAPHSIINFTVRHAAFRTINLSYVPIVGFDAS
jgi:hypothetical protein